MYDVIVVGGGPAGSSAARRCAQSGLRTLLIDKALFPRDKLCGGGVSEQALSFLDFALPVEVIEKEIYGTRVHFGQSVIEVTKPYRIAVTVSRTAFDSYLLNMAKEAGVELFLGHPVSTVQRFSDSIQVTVGDETYAAKMLIGCDGFHSNTARYVRRKHKKNEYGNTIEIKIPADEETIERYISRAVVIHFGIANGGYGWVFPHRGYFSVGIGGLADQGTNLREAMRSFLIQTGFSPDLKMKGFPIPAGGFRRKIAAERTLLAGDAAGFVDTFQGEGIAFAIRSGQLAAESAADAIKSGDFTTHGLRSYNKRCNQEFANNLRYSLYFSILMHRFPNLFLRLMASDVELFSKYLEVPARKITYRKFLLWFLLRTPYFLAKSWGIIK